MNFNIEKVKIFVSIPKKNVEEVRNAICKTAAGILGNYSCCTSSVSSVGTFKPNDKANPYIGSSNTLECVDEEILSFICDVDKVKNVLTELRKVHPYEEPAIDIVPLIDEKYFK